MENKKSLKTVVVAGHICLDIIPGLSCCDTSLLEPGKMLQSGPATISTGGVVANTGIALYKLGIPVRLAGKVGNDIFGNAALDILGSHSPGLSAGMNVSEGESSSYTIVISPPGTDRMFIHCPGTNDTFSSVDIDKSVFDGARWFHFGYPTLMKSIYSDGGREMEEIFKLAKRHGLGTSLDMSLPDENSDAGKVDWISWLRKVLPFVDVFLPSLEETRMMLPGTETPEDLTLELQKMGARIVCLKMGDNGLFCRWAKDIIRQGCFEIEVAGTTGAGDATIAGFIAAYMRGLAPREVLKYAAAAGAACCERHDATSGIPSWDELSRRISSGWKAKE